MFDLLRLPGVVPVDLRTQAGHLTIVANMVESDPPDCPDCDTQMYKHGNRNNSFADTPIEMQPTKLLIQRPRYRCKTCGKTLTPELSFLDENRRATKRLVDRIRNKCLGTTFNGLANELGLAVNTIKNIAHDYIAELESSIHYETPIIMGIDELKLAGDYRCIITNLATRSVFEMLERRTQDFMKPFFAQLTDREKVEWVCTDMWRPFKESFVPYLPNARLVIDKFHVVRMASAALEEERKAYQAELAKEERIQLKKSTRWITLKRPDSLKPSERAALEIIREKMPVLAEAYDLKEAFYRIYDEPDKSAAIAAFEDWKETLPRRGFREFRNLGKTVERHYEDIFAYWDAPIRITNAYTEGLNGLVKVANRMGRGYSYEIIRAKTLYEKHARKVGSGIRPRTHREGTDSATASQSVEYGPHIPTLVDLVESGTLT